MLPRMSRLTRSRDFTEVVRRGRRAGGSLVTVHLLPVDAALDGNRGPARAGLVVSRAVGGSVVRSRVSRRLRHLLRDRLPTLPAGSSVVVRALPGASAAPSAALAADLDRALTVASRRAVAARRGA